MESNFEAHIDDAAGQSGGETVADRVPETGVIADDQATETGVIADSRPAGAPAVPSRHSPLWKDMLRLMLVLAGCFVLVQVVLSAVLVLLVISFDPASQNYLSERTNMGANLTAVLNDPATTQFLSQRVSAYSLWMTLVGDLATVALFLIVRKKKLFTTDLTTTQPVNHRWFELTAALVLIFGVQMLLSFVNGLISLSGYDPSSVQSHLLGSDMSTVAGVIIIVLVAPFLEEWIFRGAILRQLAPYGANFAIITQATLFGLWHGNLYQGIFAFLLGLILGYVALHFSLKWSYALHAINNGFGVLSSASWMPNWVVLVILVIAVVLSFVIVVRFQQLIPVIVGEGGPRVEHPFKEGWRNPVFIIVAAVLFVISCVMMVTAGS